VPAGSRPTRYRRGVAPRPRVLAFGSAAALVLAGSSCAVLVGGLTGEVLAIALITVGLGAVVLLLFLEVGLSEERELAREAKRRRQREPRREPRLPPRRRPRRPG
jgi:peptidoglycan/LPS O-acetylase OafA/YrhL